MIRTLRKQVDGMTAVWLIYRDGRKLYTYHGVMNEIHQDDMKQAMEENYLFRYQAKRRMDTWISEKQAEGYIFEDVFGLTPNRKKRQTFKRRMIGLASLLISVGLFLVVMPFLVSPIIIAVLALLQMGMVVFSKDYLPGWLRTVCFISCCVMNVEYQEGLYAGFAIGTGTLLLFYVQNRYNQTDFLAEQPNHASI
ncbi:hypothetical protein AS033_09650 [Exiguobacterium indicum]|uniref:Uncharacterized protein n=1 Tax=Exiguobacterium indicum TaxID=296995 RepID=A0A0V8GH67_9BACL|nr:hypothetical protein [Exiguobacterium enclense]KSU49613.1 hypothetical protein AS033_09650 [Exiguobacterium enclense]SDC68040.1 hypothetical protein SAMN05216342_1965 [Exiguobacterium enclense]